MCTLTWLIKDDGYEVFFNRDEQRSRPQASSPCYDRKTDSIMPIDPQGGGSWIAVNRSGLTLCLLNNYQAQITTGIVPGMSRGLLISNLIQYNNSEEVLQQLQHVDMNGYQPFWLCIFPENLKIGNDFIFIYSWDGNKFIQKKSYQPLISSAVYLNDVEKKRTSLFKEMSQNSINRKTHLTYHCSHQPEKGKLSVCMHREDAQTQSLSHIVVSNEVVFRYHNGPPCHNIKWENITI